MSGRRRTALSPSLFPFLAVLVCTLGTLILLLALVSQKATQSAEQQARAEQAAQAKLAAPVVAAKTPAVTAKQVDTLIAEQRFRVDQLVAHRDAQTADVETKRDQLTHLEDHITRLREQLKRLSDEVDQAFDSDAKPVADDQQLASLKIQIEQEQTELEKLRGESQQRTPRIVIVPHKGPNGTDRRPVYLECTADELTIWPEGSTISLEQLAASERSANPLDAALRTVRMHAMQTYGDTTPPYPLLVVRPDGIETYAAARHAMEDWDDQFGYELVPGETKLAYAAADPNLKQRLDVAIARAAANQAPISSIAGIGNGPGGGSGGDRPLPVLSAASLDRAGRANGFPRDRDDYQFGSSYTPDPSSNRTTFSASPQPAGAETAISAAQQRQWQQQMQAANSELRSNSEPRGGSDATTGLTAGPNGQSATAGSANSAEAARGAQAGSQPNGLNFIAQGSGTELGSSTEQGSGTELGSTTATAAGDESALQSPPSGSGEVDGEFTALNSSDRMQLRSASGGAAAGGDLANGSATAPQLDSGPPPSGAASGGSSAVLPPNAGAMSGAAPDTPPPDNFQSADASPTLMRQINPQRSTVRRAGRNWGLPSEMAGMHGNAIVRTIRVQCYADRFVLLAPASGGATEMFGFSDGNIDRATLELVTAVRDRIERWGAALPGGRWQPRLEVEVMPAGETRFHQLRTLMLDSGIEIQGKNAP